MKFTTSYYELVFGLTSPIGVSQEETINCLKSLLQDHNWHYQVVSTSNLILNKPSEAENYLPEAGCTAFRLLEKQKKYQKKLNKENPFNSISASLAIDRIKSSREDNQKFCKENAKPGTVYLVTNLSESKDSDCLKSLYKEGFFQFGLTSSPESRRKNLNRVLDSLKYSTNPENEFANKVAESLEKNEISKVFVQSDFFVNTEENLKSTIERFIDLILGAPNISPTAEEHSMFMAFMSSVNSADLSRQVGAVITSKENDIIATGSNDVQKSGGGKYWPDETYLPLTEENTNVFNDKRDAALGYDANSREIYELSKQIAQSLIFNSRIKTSEADASLKEEEIVKVLREKTRLKDLTEFGRVVHAEMSALMSALRIGADVKGTTLFCTTFPCHNCAKHIIASGVSKVVYIEPYAKSKATELHDDAISIEECTPGKVTFLSFTGVGPNRYLDLFSTMGLGSSGRIKRKDADAQAIFTKKGEYTNPRIKTPLEIYSLSENQDDICVAIKTAKDIASSKEEVFNTKFKSHIKIYRGTESFNMINKVAPLRKNYPFDYGFKVSCVEPDYQDSLFEGLRVYFRLSSGKNSFLLANSITPTVEVGKTYENGDILQGEIVSTVRKTSGQWWIDKISDNHKSDYRITDEETITYLDDVDPEKVIFKLFKNSRGYYHVSEVEPFIE
ncbi:deaminase [Idiomarina aminovorans]|uniref:deaminase n=1 Tax=Idiomarina aminovorans TaxID=2914829 RepID=UPI002005B52A|nr:deaminase [Idiomarina sp. ATCH4]MCK7459309.1 deaminase [Idiomarina sp. ATCH4]